MVEDPNSETQQMPPRSASTCDSSSPANIPKGGGGDQQHPRFSPGSQQSAASSRSSSRGTLSRRGRGVRSRSPVQPPAGIVVGGEMDGGGDRASPAVTSSPSGGAGAGPVPQCRTSSPPDSPQREHHHRHYHQQPPPVRLHSGHHHPHHEGLASPIRGPSSAAAAAAAAAKAYRSGQQGDGRMSWRDRSFEYERGGQGGDGGGQPYGGRYRAEDGGGGREQYARHDERERYYDSRGRSGSWPEGERDRRGMWDGRGGYDGHHHPDDDAGYSAYAYGERYDHRGDRAAAAERNRYPPNHGAYYRHEDPYRRGGDAYDHHGGGYDAYYSCPPEGRDTPRRSGGHYPQSQQAYGGEYDDRGGYHRGGDGGAHGDYHYGNAAMRLGEGEGEREATDVGEGGDGRVVGGGGDESGVSGGDDDGNRGSKKRVMGGPTPIHVPRGTPTSPRSHSHNTRHSARQCQSQKSSESEGGSGGPVQSSNASSVFRGRPGSSPVGGAMAEDDDENSPQQILLSLRTPSHSFEEKPTTSFPKPDGGRKAAAPGREEGLGGDDRDGGSDGKKSKKGAPKGKRQQQNQAPPSPEEPPRIQHSHHQRKSSDPLFFEPTRSPKPGSETKPSGSTSLPIEPAPSFQLLNFNQSFDSLGVGEGNINLSMSGIDPNLSFGFGPVPSSKSKDEGGDGGGGGVVVRAGSYLTGNGEPNSSLRLTGSMGLALTGSFGTAPDGRRQQYLGGSGSAGSDEGGNTMVLGVSPSSSFGAAVRSSARASGGPTIVLGGTPSPERSAASSAGDDRPVRSPSSSFERDHHKQRGRYRSSSRSRDQSRPSGPDDPGAPPGSPPRTHFYDVLKRHKMAFKGFIFLLPGLKKELEAAAAVEAESADSPPPKSTHQTSSPTPSPSRSSGLDVKLDEEAKPPSTSPAAEGKTPDPGAGGAGAKAESAQASASPEVSVSSSPTRPKNNASEHSQPSDTEVARRRVKSAVCAFGGSGYFVEKPPSEDDSLDEADKKPSTESEDKKSASIFRSKKEDVSPGKARSSFETTDTKSKIRRMYDKKLPGRYYENENRLSWEIEDSPPIDIVTDDNGATDHESGPNNNKRQAPQGHGQSDVTDRHGKKSKVSHKKEDGSFAGDGAPSNYESAAKNESPATCPSPQPKMRYRCKLCGQPKQNHNCPYQQSLQRSIGTMVYPAVNAFTAIEPGVLAPALSEMNNFVSSSGSEPSSTATTPSRQSSVAMVDRSGMMVVHPTPANTVSSGSPHNVTPETLRSSMGQHHINSPGGSSLSTAESPTRGRTPGSSARNRGEATPAPYHRRRGGQYPATGPRRKRYLPQMGTPGSVSSSSVASDLLFVDATDLMQEQFRIASSPIAGKHSEPSDGTYEYPSIPLPYAQRKRLSDNLFAMSKEIPHLTDECALVLREAREKDMWDRAVSELMTQVLVIVRCPEEDDRLEGIRQYLLTLGISC